MHSARFVDQSPAEVYATLLEEQTYLCSPRTMYRVLAEADEVRERRHQVRHPAYVKPELIATAPNQVWSWDITKLKGPVLYLYYSLYVGLIRFRGHLSKGGYDVQNGITHRGNTRAPSATTSWLGTMTPTTTAASAISRRPPCITAARRRSSTCVTAPASWAYAAHPERFVSGPPRPETLPTAVWINPPSKTTRQDAPGPTTGTPDDSQHAVVARPRPPLDRSSLHRVDGVESLQFMLNQVVSKTLTRPDRCVRRRVNAQRRRCRRRVPNDNINPSAALAIAAWPQ